MFGDKYSKSDMSCNNMSLLLLDVSTHSNITTFRYRDIMIM